MPENEEGLANELIRFVATTVAGIKSLTKEDEQRLNNYLHGQHCERFKSFLGLMDGQEHSTLFVLLFEELERILVTIDFGEEMVENNNWADEKYSTLLIVKSKNAIVDAEPITTQVNVIYLPGPVNTGNLASIVTHGVSSVFGQLVKSDAKSYSVETIDKTRRKLDDISKQFQQLHNSIETPDLLGMVPSSIKDAVSKGATSHEYASYFSSNDLNDIKILNSLQSVANKWVLVIKQTLAIDRDIKDGSVLNELEFWSNMHEVLKSLIQQTQNQGFQICLSILTSAKRFHNLTNMLNEGALSEKLKQVDRYDQFLSSIPIDEVHQSTNLEHIRESFVTLASSLKRFRYSNYPVQRFIILMDKVSQEVIDALLNSLSNIFKLEYGSFLALYKNSIQTIEDWDVIVQDINLLIREDLRKNAPHELLSQKLAFTSELVKDTLNQILTIRNRFFSLAETLKTISPSTYHDEIQKLYEPFQQIDDISTNFKLRLEQSERQYSKSMFDLETKLQGLLANVVDSGRYPIEKLSHLVEFKPLMEFCPRIKVKVQENQQILLTEIKKEILQLEAGLNSLPEILQLEELNGIPPISAKISYYLRVQSHIDKIAQYLEVLFGSSWSDTLEGRSISTSILQLRKDANPQEVFLQWLNNFPEQITTNLLIMPVLKLIRNSKDSYELKVNFDFVLAAAYKELRNLTYMAFQVPSHVARIARAYMNLYPRAITLVELIQTFFSVNKSLSENFYTNVFLKKRVQTVWLILQQFLETSWESLHVVDSTNKETPCSPYSLDVLEKVINDVISDYQILKNSEAQLAKEFSLLNRFEGTASEFHKVGKVIGNIQVILEDFSAKGLASVSNYISGFNDLIINILLEKTSINVKNLRFPKHTFKLKFDKGKITPSPSLNEIKGFLLKDIEILLNAVTQIELLHDSENPVLTTLTFDAVVSKLEDDIRTSLEEIQALYLEINAYVKEWQKMDFLWKFTEQSLLETIDNNTQKCFEILTGLLGSKSSFDQLLSRNNFGTNFEIQTQETHNYIRSKINFWVSYVSKHLLKLYDHDARQLDEDMNRDRETLEDMDVNFSSLNNITIIIEAVTMNKRHVIEREAQIKLLRSVTRTLTKLRVEFPPKFVYIEQLDIDFGTLRECLGRMEQEMQEHRVLIAQRLEQEVKNIDELSRSLNESWSVRKPISPTLTPPEALEILDLFNKSLSTLKTKVECITNAAKMLLIPVILKDQLAHTVEEVKQYKLVWKSIEDLWKNLQKTVETPWCRIDILSLQPQLTDLLQSANELPRVVKQFEIFKSLFSQINMLSSVNRTLTELKDPALKPRHWNMIFRDIGKRQVQKDLVDRLEFPLRDVMLLNLTLNEMVVTKIIQRAQKEFVIEKSLNRIKTFWKEAQYDVREHPSGIKLVGEWDVLEQACREDLEELISMRTSNYYKIFEQDCLDFESKLTKLSGNPGKLD